MNTLDVIRVARDAEQEGRHDVAAAVLADVAPDFEYRGRRAVRIRRIWWWRRDVVVTEFTRAADGELRCNGVTDRERAVDIMWLAWVEPDWHPLPEPDNTWRFEEQHRLASERSVDVEAARHVFEMPPDQDDSNEEPIYCMDCGGPFYGYHACQPTWSADDGEALVSHDPAEPRD